MAVILPVAVAVAVVVVVVVAAAVAVAAVAVEGSQMRSSQNRDLYIQVRWDGDDEVRVNNLVRSRVDRVARVLVCFGRLKRPI